MDRDPPFNALAWAVVIRETHKDMTALVIAGHMELNAENPTASANWQLIREAFDRLTGSSKRCTIPGLPELVHVA